MTRRAIVECRFVSYAIRGSFNTATILRIWRLRSFAVCTLCLFTEVH